MAELGRTVRVSGLPTDIEDDRLKDKLFIHFLRASNGGGEIDSVIIVKATPGSALITFEDSGVSQRVIQRSRHILDVDGVQYELLATEQRESLDPDQIIVSLSATVDYRRLPGGVEAISGLSQNHRDVHINYTSTEGCCRLSGAYSKVQAALAQLLSHPGGSAENKDADEPTPSGLRPVQTAQKSGSQELKDQSRKPNKQREQMKKNSVERLPDEKNSSAKRDLTPGGYGWEDPGQEGTAALQIPTTSMEEFSLIVDADMFQYLQKTCRKEYQSILRQYDVEVLDMTNEGLTTLFLQIAPAMGEGGGEQERLELARKAISKLYQENETKTRRSQLPKVILSSKGELKRAVESLRARYPNLLLNEDDQYIYIIGSGSDVSEAKQFFLVDCVRVSDEKEDKASKFSSHASVSSTHANEERVPLTLSSTVGSLDGRTRQLLRSDEDERRAEGVRRYKLAPRFKDSGMGALGVRTTDFTLRTNSSPSRPTRQGPMLGHDVLSETAGTSGEAVSRAVAQNTGGDIFSKSVYAPPLYASMQSKTSLNPDLMDTRLKNVASPFISTETDLSGSTPPPPVESGSTLKRTSSFSGMTQKVAQVLGQKSQDDSSKSTVRPRSRSSSFSTQKGSERPEVHIAELTLSAVEWQHIKKAYKPLVDDLTSDVQMRERCLEGSTDMTVTLRGANSSKVISCQQGLQKLIDSVISDLSVQELRLSELGVTDTTDETLQACCSEVRSRFKKVTIQFCKDKLYLIGPQLLCSQVGASLREIFSGALGQIPEQSHGPRMTTSTWALPSSSLMNEEQITNLHSNHKSQVMLESKTGKDDGTSRSQDWQTTYRSDFREIDQLLARKDHVTKKKVKLTGTVGMDGQKTEPVGCVNGVGSTTASTVSENAVHTTQIDGIGQEQANTPEESKSGQGGLGCTCVCGDDGAPMIRAKCGVTVQLHASCRVCHETEQKPRSIQGRMVKSKLTISVPGHNKTCAIKITYHIPDGIQGESHPSPGKPFQGGTFEAYLPECEKTKKLLPRLEKAFRQGLTFTVTEKETEARVTWDCIPHKTSLQGGKSGNGYPDSSYLTRLSEVLTSHGIEEFPVKYK